jgi:hypothetical protein
MNMFRAFLSSVLLLPVLAVPGRPADPPEPLPLRLLYVGNAGTPRGRAYAAFLGRRFARVAVAEREGFDPARARDADVVMLDWSQSDPRTKPLTAPLGKRAAWGKPTVLLGSAGHLVAGAWEVHGGSG